MSRYISIFLFFLSFAALATESKTITLGINSCSDPISHPEVIESVITLTKKAIKPLGFELKVNYLDLKQLAEEVKNKQIDCFVASSGFYRRMAGEGVRDLATAISYKEPDPNFGAASTFITFKNGAIDFLEKPLDEIKFFSTLEKVLKSQGTRLNSVEAQLSRINVIRSLSEREKQICSLLSEGLSKKSIGKRLSVSEKTVEAHTTSAYRKLQIHRLEELKKLGKNEVSVS